MTRKTEIIEKYLSKPVTKSQKQMYNSKKIELNNVSAIGNKNYITIIRIRPKTCYI